MLRAIFGIIRIFAQLYGKKLQKVFDAHLLRQILDNVNHIASMLSLGQGLLWDLLAGL